jgi:PTH1 family peptidyl-tRNA hydrolase
MLLIIGLGNPGKKYIGTRHNVGFEFLDKLKKEWNFPKFEFSNKFDSEISEGNYKLQTTNYKLLLIKPQTFMNLSGSAVQDIMSFYKLSPNDILIIHDDKDIALGEYRSAADSSSAGHNGVQNIIDQIGTQKFKRIRIGIGTETDLPSEVFVLQKFSDEEKEKIEKVLDEVLEEVKKYL